GSGEVFAQDFLVSRAGGLEPFATGGGEPEEVGAAVEVAGGAFDESGLFQPGHRAGERALAQVHLGLDVFHLDLLRLRFAAASAEDLEQLELAEAELVLCL